MFNQDKLEALDRAYDANQDPGWVLDQVLELGVPLTLLQEYAPRSAAAIPVAVENNRRKNAELELRLRQVQQDFREAASKNHSLAVSNLEDRVYEITSVQRQLYATKQAYQEWLATQSGPYEIDVL